ncbi:MAG TPA: hypothetical protein RMH99_25500 [Sandaracinaceae bacterium LLY-WYZ-13_1]|nr:hypothetical protein [Sandaracinaceae bacterium LLY-WYZ-13_1]
MAKTPLERPALPEVTRPLERPGRTVAVHGPGAEAFARALAADLPEPARLVRVALRHAPGFEVTRDGDATVVHAHPDALVEAVSGLSPDDATVGVGPAWAVAVRADLHVWIRAGRSLASLPAPLREPARRASLVLEEARLETARALASALATPRARDL